MRCNVPDRRRAVHDRRQVETSADLYDVYGHNTLKKKTKGITNAMLSSTLKELEEDGLVTRKQYEEMPVRVEYSLTEKGRSLWPIIHRLGHWARGEEFDG